jgi:hypothetical protein
LENRDALEGRAASRGGPLAGPDLLALAGDARFADSPCWVFGSSRPLAGAEGAVGSRLADFMARWQSHGAPVAGLYGIVHSRFLVIVQSPEGAAATGCSIDSMKGEIAALEGILSTRLQDGGRIYYRGPDGAVESATRAEFKALAAEGRITPDTEVFDLTVTRFGDLRPGVFAKKLRDSWHLKLYENATRPAA